jgi:excisionase family DNA binding protein
MGSIQCLSGRGKQMKQKVREKVIAELLGISERTVRNWRASRIIPYTKVGRIILFDPEAVERALLKFERKASG